MRKKVVIANWKMNNSFSESINLVENILSQCNINNLNNTDVVIAPSFVYLQAISDLLKKEGSILQLAAQNCSEHEKGAYTGEVSIQMLHSVAVNYVIIGHSERRTLFNEGKEVLTKKINLALKQSISPIYCIGESLQEREANTHFNLIKKQISEVLFNLSAEEIKKCIIAYEPVWAIGTGLNASAQQAEEIHQYIRDLIAKQYTSNLADTIKIVYGGSCSENNAKELFSCPNIDGGLIGGASLKANSFVQIIQFAEDIKN